MGYGIESIVSGDLQNQSVDKWGHFIEYYQCKAVGHGRSRLIQLDKVDYKTPKPKKNTGMGHRKKT
jgi:hypothetical protein